MKMIKKGLGVAVATLAQVVAATAVNAADYPSVTLKYALYFSENIPQAKVLKWWGNELEERSGGNIKVQFFWSQTLGKSTELLELVGQGAVELSSPAPAYYASKLPLVNVHQLPMIFPSNAAAQRTAEEMVAVPGVVEEHDRNNVVPVLWTSLPTYHVLCTKKIETLADFSGAKMRSYGEYVPKLWDSLDAVPVTVLAPEIYEGLQRGNIDCSYLPDDFAYAYKLHEVADYYIDLNFGAISGWPTYVNKDLWDGWSDEVHALFAEVGAEAAAMDRETVHQAGEDAKAKFLEAGLELVEFTETEKVYETAPDFLEVWIAEMGSKGLGDAAREVAAVVREQVASEAN
ncbi:C4-dicarboxylate TRAP transporter substrate-binding protein [Roseovarius sp.]|uniref:C4-dicarboxylate TRAP transporter substrate-binding protein n=1 Tax=Roseovarius sp. TaxID=1486281 RepID=UPI003A975031